VQLRQTYTGRQIFICSRRGQWLIEVEGRVIDLGQRSAASREPVTRLECLSWAANRRFLEVDRVELRWLSATELLAAYARGERCFRHVNLDGAPLAGAHLAGIDLRGSRLCWADLRGADLSGALLSETDLLCADLRDAQLAGVDLSRSNLRGARLHADPLRAEEPRSRCIPVVEEMRD
jgi:hypothetical protein